MQLFLREWWPTIVVGLAVAIIVFVVGYWQLIVAEGAYLGRWIVTLMYDWFAPRYDSVKGFDPTYEAIALAEPVLRHIKTTVANTATYPSQIEVLDVATGTGRLPAALLFQPTFKGRVIGVDASRRMLKIAQDKLSGHESRVQWQLGDAQRLDFTDGRFDVVGCLEALEFFPDPSRALRELIRVLKPGGLLVVTNRIGPDAWKLPGRAMPTERFMTLLHDLGLRDIEHASWMVDYDLIFAVKPA